MAKLIPAIDDCGSSTNSSERKVAEALTYHLNDNCLIWANPRIPPNNLEADFIVLDPSKGLIVIEVKGWNLSTIGQASSNSVTLITPNGNSQANNPMSERQLWETQLKLQMQIFASSIKVEISLVREFIYLLSFPNQTAKR